MEIKKGYKHTELGIIPEDWEIKRLGEISAFNKGKMLSKSDLNTGGKNKCIHYGELFTTYSEVIKNIKSRTNVAENIFASKKNDILMPTSAETPNGLAIASCIDEDGVILGGDILVIRVPANILNGVFFSYLISISKHKIMQLITGSTVYHLYGSDMSKFEFNLPKNIKEQKAIAEVLSDTGNLIQAIEQKIAKKRAIKQGAMQQLLTPQKDWAVKKLGEICGRITTGKLDANAMIENGVYRFYTCAKKYFYIDNYVFDVEALLVSGNGNNVGYIHYYKGKFNAYQRTYVLYGFNENILYIKLFMDKYLKERIDKQKNDGNTPYIKIDTLTEMEFHLPPLPEQKAIATILSDMDAEIAQLEQNMLKYTQIKQGLMQNLLTGTIRLG